MNSRQPTDTSPEVRARHGELIAALSPAERLARALALSTLARDFVWAGARGGSGGQASEAVHQRFLVQMYGDGVARWVARRIAAEGVL